MPIAAAIGTSIVGTAVAKDSADDDRAAATTANTQALEAEAAALNFSKEQYNDWKSIYGPIQENLADYYGSLTAGAIETKAITAIEQERATVLDRINTNFAQRGIEDSGLAAATVNEVEISTAQQRAQARADAPMLAAQEKSKFLSAGLGLDPSGTTQSVLNTQASTATSRANTAMSNANTSANAAGEALAGTIGVINNAWSDE